MNKVATVLVVMLFLPFVIAGPCDSDLNLSGNAAVTVDVPQAIVTYALENGISYIRVTQADIVIECIALDPSALYSPTFQSLTFQDTLRLTNYTAEELAKCS